MRKIGYARVSGGDDQTTALQVDALHKAGCEKVFEEIASGAKRDRLILKQALAECRKGDILVVWKLDRLGRSLQDLLRQLSTLSERGVGFMSLTEAIETTTPTGRMLTAMLGAFAEFERDMIRERTRAGLDAARKRGRTLGRPKGASDEKIAWACEQICQDEMTQIEVARSLGVHRATVARWLKKKGIVR